MVNNMIKYTVQVDGDRTEWRLDGKLHRVDGPAIEYADGGAREWYLNGYLHREDGPAVEGANGDKAWFLNGKHHREDGPAIEWADGTNEWCLHGWRVSEEQFNQRTKTKELTIAQLEEILGYKIKVIGERT